MHKRIVNEAYLKLEISPRGPVLIKSGGQGADPTKPDMEFVETHTSKGRHIYLPGSSLKGALRAHAERIIRTVGGSDRAGGVWSCDPLDEESWCRKGLSEKYEKSETRSADIYRESCTICKLFGSTELASHFRISDAYPANVDEIRLEERNGVAIDRVFGSVAAGPFNYEVATSGIFNTEISVRNFTISQLALLALTIRDFAKQRVSLGFAKSRGMGQVDMRIKTVRIRYPLAVKVDEQIVFPKNLGIRVDSNTVLGAGEFVDENEKYGYPRPDRITVEGAVSNENLGLGVAIEIDDPDSMNDLWRRCVGVWREEIIGG